MLVCIVHQIRCTAHVYSIYLQSLEKSAEEERVRTTAASLPEIKEAIVYSIQREPENSKIFKIVPILPYRVLHITADPGEERRGGRSTCTATSLPEVKEVILYSIQGLRQGDRLLAGFWQEPASNGHY